MSSSTPRSRGHRAPDRAQSTDAPPLAADELAQIERNLLLTPSERLDQLVRAVSFIQAGREALAKQNE